MPTTWKATTLVWPSTRIANSILWAKNSVADPAGLISAYEVQKDRVLAGKGANWPLL